MLKVPLNLGGGGGHLVTAISFVLERIIRYATASGWTSAFFVSCMTLSSSSPALLHFQEFFDEIPAKETTLKIEPAAILAVVLAERGLFKQARAYARVIEVRFFFCTLLDYTPSISLRVTIAESAVFSYSAASVLSYR